MMTAFEEICFWLMAAMPWIMLACLFTDRERPTSKRYWWYLPPSILSLLTAIAVGLPQIVDKRIGGFGCWCTLIFTFVCSYHDEMEGLENLHGKLICPFDDLSCICHGLLVRGVLSICPGRHTLSFASMRPLKTVSIICSCTVRLDTIPLALTDG